jgi:hypothetical protein
LIGSEPKAYWRPGIRWSEFSPPAARATSGHVAAAPPRRRAAEDRDERAPLQSNSLAYPCRPATVIEITADFNDDVDRLFVATCSIGYSRLITNRLATINR